MRAFARPVPRTGRICAGGAPQAMRVRLGRPTQPRAGMHFLQRHGHRFRSGHRAARTWNRSHRAVRARGALGLSPAHTDSRRACSPRSWPPRPCRPSRQTGRSSSWCTARPPAAGSTGRPVGRERAKKDRSWQNAEARGWTIRTFPAGTSPGRKIRAGWRRRSPNPSAIANPSPAGRLGHHPRGTGMIRIALSAGRIVLRAGAHPASRPSRA